MENKLSKEELSHLLGGVSNTGSLPGGNSSNISSGADVGIDVRNINRVDGCICEYNNTPQAISNENDIKGCQCICWPR